MNAERSLIGMAGREFELLCLTGRVDFGDTAAAAVRSLIGEDLSWSEFLAGVERNYVAPLVHRNLKSLGAGVVPPKVLETLRVRSKITAIKSEHFTDELLRLYRLFESESIQTVHYKGAATAAEYYGSVTLRNFNDLDFLVRREDVPAMCRILEAQGYRMQENLRSSDFEHYVAQFKEFAYQRGDICLEPHWSLAGRRYPFDTDYEGFWRRSGTFMLRDTPLRVMSAEDSLLVLCLVGAKGRWQRLQMVTDVAACARHFPQMDWVRVCSMAAETGTVRILHLGLLLAAELAGLPLPEGLSGAVRKSPQVGRLASEVVKTMNGPRTRRRFLPDSPATFSMQLFRQRERYRDRWHYLWHTATTPNQLHLQRLPLPKVGYPLYTILVPLHDFVMYPAWQLGKSMLRRVRH